MVRRRATCGSISGRAMATAYARWILSTHSGSTLKMQGFEPSIDLGFENVFFQKGYQLKNCLGEFVCPHRGGHGTLSKCRGSSWRLLWWPPLIFKTSWGNLGGPEGTPQETENAPSSLLRSALVSRHRIPPCLHGIMPPRRLPHCKYAAIRAVARGSVKMN